MSYTVTEGTLDGLSASWSELQHHLSWDCIFVLPNWLQAWWRAFGAGAELYLRSIKQSGATIGISPLLIKESKVSFISSPDVCDYVDFAIAAGRERDFFNVLLDDLRHKAVSHLSLEPVRADSTVITILVDMARDKAYEVSCKLEDVSLELDLPATWDEYLAILTAKQRHELRRKIRRLQEMGSIDYRVVENIAELPNAIDTFIGLFRDSRQDKASFMTAQMESFFRLLGVTMAEAGLLKFGFLELDASPVAAVMYFDYKENIYLYNSGYDPKYSFLSVGLLCKALCIKDSIQRRKKKFDFLKGAEIYKYRLGGKEIPIYSCQIVLS